MSRPFYVVVMGVSGCGKSTTGATLAQALNASFIDGDDLHPETNIRKMTAGIALNDDDRWPWLDQINLKAAESLASGQSLVVACSALKKSYRRRLCSDEANAVFVYLDGSVELITERQSSRKDHFMPATLVESQFAALEPPHGESNVVCVSLDQSVHEVVCEAQHKLAQSGFL